MNKVVIFVVIGAVAIIGIWLGTSYVSAVNTEVSMRKQVEAQNEVCKSFYDKMWKIIAQKANVTKEHKESFKEIYVGIMDARYQKGDGTLMKWIKESNPDFDSSLFKDLQRSIEIERNSYLAEEKKLIDLDREHDTYIALFPNSMFVGSKGETEIQTVRSSRTNKSFETGEDDNVSVF